jgi:hypothetical protein
VAIAQQPATTTQAISARPPLARPPHELFPVPAPRRAWTVVKLVSLVALTAAGAALATAVVAGVAFFAILNVR